MKITNLFAICSLAFLSAPVAAYVTLGSFPYVVEIGQTYTLTWTATANYSYALWLVVATNGEDEYSWEPADVLGKDLVFDTLNGSFAWTVESNISTAGIYALWLDGIPSPFTGSSYPNQTEWFTITTSNITTTPSSTSSSTSTPTSTSSATSTTAPASQTSSASSSPSHHSSISGGAIAGIVIGCLLLIALVVGAVIFTKWRRKRSEKQGREAAQRASRLAPVMQHSYEMHGRTPAEIKETNV